jgi:hypothetical protein
MALEVALQASVNHLELSSHYETVRHRISEIKTVATTEPLVGQSWLLTSNCIGGIEDRANNTETSVFDSTLSTSNSSYLFYIVTS